MKNQQGFSLIELAVVITIIGVLSAAAMPKYLDMVKDAKVSVLKSTASAIKSADNMVFAKAIITRSHKGEEKITYADGTFVNAINGHIKVDETNLAKAIDSDMNVIVTSTGVALYDGKVVDDASKLKECHVSVTQDASGLISTSILSDDC